MQNRRGFLLIVVCVFLSLQPTRAQVHTPEKITMSQKDASLATVLDEIERQTGYHYFMNAQWESDARKVNIEVANADLKNVLDLCFKEQPFTYEIVGKTIVIKQKDSVHLE